MSSPTFPLPKQDHAMDERQKPEAKRPQARIERYPFTQPGGKVVTIEHDIDAGTTRVIEP